LEWYQGEFCREKGFW